MQGIGPASASAILTAADPALPFMSDEAVAAALGGKPTYTAKQYVQYAIAMRKRAAELSTEGKTPWSIKSLVICKCTQQAGTDIVLHFFWV